MTCGPGPVRVRLCTLCSLREHLETVRREAGGSVFIPSLARVTWSKVCPGLSFGVLRGKGKVSLRSFREKKLGYLRWPLQVAAQMRDICEHEPRALRLCEARWACRIGQSHHGGPCAHKESTAEIEQALVGALSGGRASAEGAGDSNSGVMVSTQGATQLGFCPCQHFHSYHSAPLRRKGLWVAPSDSWPAPRFGGSPSLFGSLR